MATMNMNGQHNHTRGLGLGVPQGGHYPAAHQAAPFHPEHNNNAPFQPYQEPVLVAPPPYQQTSGLMSPVSPLTSKLPRMPGGNLQIRRMSDKEAREKLSQYVRARLYRRCGVESATRRGTMIRSDWRDPELELCQDLDQSKAAKAIDQLDKEKSRRKRLEKLPDDLKDEIDKAKLALDEDDARFEHKLVQLSVEKRSYPRALYNDGKKHRSKSIVSSKKSKAKSSEKSEIATAVLYFHRRPRRDQDAKAMLEELCFGPMQPRETRGMANTPVYANQGVPLSPVSPTDTRVPPRFTDGATGQQGWQQRPVPNQGAVPPPPPPPPPQPQGAHVAPGHKTQQQQPPPTYGFPPSPRRSVGSFHSATSHGGYSPQSEGFFTATSSTDSSLGERHGLRGGFGQENNQHARNPGQPIPSPSDERRGRKPGPRPPHPRSPVEPPLQQSGKSSGRHAHRQESRFRVTGNGNLSLPRNKGPLYDRLQPKDATRADHLRHRSPSEDGRRSGWLDEGNMFPPPGRSRSNRRNNERSEQRGRSPSHGDRPTQRPGRPGPAGHFFRPRDDKSRDTYKMAKHVADGIYNKHSPRSPRRGSPRRPGWSPPRQRTRSSSSRGYDGRYARNARDRDMHDEPQRSRQEYRGRTPGGAPFGRSDRRTPSPHWNRRRARSSSRHYERRDDNHRRW